MKNDITIGEIVTWGSGAPRAEVVLMSQIDGDASLVLSQDLKSPCGRVFIKGCASPCRSATSAGCTECKVPPRKVILRS